MHRGGWLALVLASFTPAFSGCAQEEYPLSLWLEQHPPQADASVAPSTVEVQSGPLSCAQARAESLPARLVAMSTSAPTAAAPILAQDIFQQNFIPVCGSCHGPTVDPPGNGGFQLQTGADFMSKLAPNPSLPFGGGQGIINHALKSVCPNAPAPNAPDDPMPPCSSPNGETYAMRGADDPVRAFAQLTQEWLNAGGPPSFVPSSSGADAGTAAPSASFAMSPQTGNTMTNLGNCVPGSGLYLSNMSVAMAKDALFASLKRQPSGTASQIIGLPDHLGETDMISFDSAVLAQTGVVAYAPGYPLWTDDAGKLRYIRVPVGQSVHFNKQTQQFDIPPNTRFYKTFMKQIADTDGSLRYRKMETRLIVSRPDQNNPDGTVDQTALFGTYQWNDDETDAVLVQAPLNDGLPFADTVLLYNTDEQLAAELLLGQPANPEETLLENGAARHYAIPSSQRCIQCHMGSPSQAFSLGFTPLQINRRPTGTGGVIEATGADELTQLQRFIDLGIITGIDSTSDVLPLEQSQGSRTPRNDYELVAQGYVLGNCSHCHNPRGYPTVQNPVLLNVLSFLPSTGPIGGLFQFPLERYSPRIGRGTTGTTLIPYVTPSLVDLPKQDPSSGAQIGDFFVDAPTAGQPPLWVDYAPWRSIIYRNVDAGFAYTDDLALFPHMPMNSVGYDPRAKQILSDWMVSIPAVRKRPDVPEYAYQTDAYDYDNVNGPVVDSSPQPYVEVLPGDPRYAAATAAAQERLTILHTGTNPAVPLRTGSMAYSRYSDPGETEDIIDPAVTADPICHPIPVGNASVNHYPLPNHPHWVITDTTQVAGPWAPRRADWASVLVSGQTPTPPSGNCASAAGQSGAYQDQLDAINLLQTATLEQVKGYATTAIPFGLWQEEPGCDLSKQPTVGSFTGSSRPHWMDVADPTTGSPPPADAPVYQETPGAAIFKMICINCHGPNADANGRMAFNLAIMTGGVARVADFKDGFFGPTTSPGSNEASVFSPSAVSAALMGKVPPNWIDAPDGGAPLTTDDIASRYMPWMALGGTEVIIPQPILQIVAATKVLDAQRTIASSQLSANMLSEAKALCLSLLGPTIPNLDKGAVLFGSSGLGYLAASTSNLNTTLLFTLGDAEMWLHLCNLNNPPPVHVVTPYTGEMQYKLPSYEGATGALDIEQAAPSAYIRPDEYPPNTGVGDQTGSVVPSLTADNEWPWCVDPRPPSSNKPNPPWLQPAIAAGTVPVCPTSVLQISDSCNGAPTGPSCYSSAAASKWAVRGAINAGMSVFTYVQSIDKSGPPPDYNQCNLLP